MYQVFPMMFSMDYIYGVGKVGDRIVTLLNLEKLTDIDEEDKQGD